MINVPIEIDGANPARFEEAIAEFGALAPWVSGSSWSYVAQLAAQKGDQISGTTLLSVLDSVFKEMDRAVAEGKPYSEFLRDVAPKLDQQWYDVDSPRMRLIFDNNVGGALMEGRLRQMDQVIDDRPFRLFDGIADWRQSEICAARDGMIMRADDPRWADNTPLMHHHCRSGLISLDEEEAQEFGGVSGGSVLPLAPPPGQGWGSRYSWQDWQPQPGAYEPTLYDNFKAWTESQPYARSRADWEEALRRQVQTSLPGEARLPVDVALPRVSPRPGASAPRIQVEESPEQRAARERRQVREYLDAWVVGSRSKRSVTLKKAAKQALGLPGIAYSRRQYRITEQAVDELAPVAQQIYDDTQKALRGLHPSGYVRLYRGVETPPEIMVAGVLESWTTSKEIAEMFAGRRRRKRGQPGDPIKGREDAGQIFYYDIPVEAIFAFSGGPSWQNGKYGQQFEYVVTSARTAGQLPVIEEEE